MIPSVTLNALSTEHTIQISYVDHRHPEPISRNTLIDFIAPKDLHLSLHRLNLISLDISLNSSLKDTPNSEVDTFLIL